MKMEKAKSGCLNLWVTILAPVIVNVVLAYLGQRLVIQITGFQISIGLTILITFVFFVVIVTSFLLGMAYVIFGVLSLILRFEMPLIFHIVTNIILKPIIWIYSRFLDKETLEADKQDLAEFRTGLAAYHARVDRELKERRENEPPTQDTH